MACLLNIAVLLLTVNAAYGWDYWWHRFNRPNRIEADFNFKRFHHDSIEIQPESNPGKKIVCYYGSWAVYRPGDGKFDVENIDPNLCTHAIFGFAGLDSNNKIKVLDSWNEIDKKALKRFVDLKQKNRSLKTLIAIGGWNEGSEKYSNMAASYQSRKVFIRSVMDFLNQHKFDGLDVDWEYPANRGGKPEDKNNFSTLLKELKAAFKPKGYLLTIAVGAGKSTVDSAYDIKAISQSVDFINLMTYDVHGPWEKKTGANTPMKAGPNARGDDKFLTVEYAVKYWMEKGAPKNKLVLGMALYGHSFTLANPGQNGLAAAASGPGKAGQFTREAGILGYNEICDTIKRDKWSGRRDSDSQTPYAFKGDQWVSYDDVESIRIKTRFIKQNDLAGGMVWSIETDDFQGKCGNGKFPLLKAINTDLR